MPAEDNGFLPDTKTVTPQEQGAAVTQQLTEEQAKVRLKARLDELDISDPGAEPVAAEAKPEVKAEAAKPAVLPEADRAAEFPADLLARAREHGITAGEAKEYGSPTQLDRALNHLDRAVARRTPPPPQSAPPVEAAEEDWQFPELPAPSSEDHEWDPHLQQWVQQTKAGFDKLREENKALKGTIEQVNQHLQKQEVLRLTEQWDGFFEKAPDDYKDALGAGSIYDLDGKPEADTRREVLRTYLALEQTYRQAGQRVPSFKVLADRALRAVVTPTTKAETTAKLPANAPTGATTIDANGRYHDAQGRILALPTARKDSANTSNVNGDTPPADPKLRDEWAARRFRRRAVEAFGDE